MRVGWREGHVLSCWITEWRQWVRWLKETGRLVFQHLHCVVILEVYFVAGKANSEYQEHKNQQSKQCWSTPDSQDPFTPTRPVLFPKQNYGPTIMLKWHKLVPWQNLFAYCCIMFYSSLPKLLFFLPWLYMTISVICWLDCSHVALAKAITMELVKSIFIP